MVANVTALNYYPLDKVVDMRRLEDGPVYAIGDIHGCSSKLRKLLHLVKEDATCRGIESPRVIFLGDYVDRGIDSYGVLEILDRCRCGEYGLDAMFLYGNHENMMINGTSNQDFRDTWDRNGGQMAIESFLDHGYSVKDVLSKFHGLFEAMEFGYETSSHLFVHAGLNPKMPKSFQRVIDVLWTRHKTCAMMASKTVVHGHTIVGTVPLMNDDRVAIDTGAFKGGPLTAVFIEGVDASPRFIQA